jgi:hypothetical protein
VRRLHTKATPRRNGSMTGDKAAVDSSRAAQAQCLLRILTRELRCMDKRGTASVRGCALSLCLIGVSVLRCSPPMVD